MFSRSAEGEGKISKIENFLDVRPLQARSEIMKSSKIIEKHIVSLYSVLRAVSRAQMARALPHGIIGMQECKKIEFLQIPGGYFMEISMVKLLESSRNRIFSLKNTLSTFE